MQLEALELLAAPEYLTTLTVEGHARCIDEAMNAGFEIVRGAPNELLLDLDVPFEDHYERSDRFVEIYDAIDRNFPIKGMERWASKSGNTHVRIVLHDSLPVVSRLVLQAALGSDGVREALAVKRWLNGVAEPSVLFKPKGAK